MKWKHAVMALILLLCGITVAYIVAYHKAEQARTAEVEKYLVHYPAATISDLERQDDKQYNADMPDNTASFGHFDILGQEKVGDSEYRLYGLELRTYFYIADSGELIDEMDPSEYTSDPVILYVEKEDDGFALKRVENAYDDEANISEDFPLEFLNYVESKSDDFTLHDFYEKDRAKAEKQFRGKSNERGEE